MQAKAFTFTGETYEPVKKPEPKTAKGTFQSFGKNSKFYYTDHYYNFACSFG